MNYKYKRLLELDALSFLKRINGNLHSKKTGKLLHVLRGEKLHKVAIKLHEKAYDKIGQLSAEGYYSLEPLAFADRFTGKKINVKVGNVWAKNVFDCMWLHVTADCPSFVTNYEDIVIIIDCGGEGLIVDCNGVPKQAVTCYASDHDYSLGSPHKRVVLSDGLINNGKIDFWIDCAGNDLFGKFPDSAKVLNLDIATMNHNVRALAYDMEIASSIYSYLANKDANKVYNIAKQLSSANKISEQNASDARVIIAPIINNKNTKDQFAYSVIGHAHLDLAWLWPIRETKRKGIRTFSTQLMNLQRYEDYMFGASQAQLYDWVKMENPDIYKKMTEYIKLGRWEVQGATWVEMDSNLISGESMVRQFYYGKQYFQKEFGLDMKVLWLPDSFGYSPCLPQVMKLANVPYFLTQKMSWNTVTKFPYHTFNWQGLDGSKVFAHMLPDNTYNSPCTAEKMVFGVKNYQENKISNEAIMLMGIGDGGAGPGFEHIERAIREKDIEGIPKVVMEKSVDFFDKLVGSKDKFKTHIGELYLEKHQGTYTTQSLNKFYNRKCEFALRNYEYLVSIMQENVCLPISADDLDIIWKEILLYQFHDILPGSSINRVYDESVERYKNIYENLNKSIGVLLAKVSDKKCVYNFNSFDYNYKYKRANKWYQVTAKKLTHSYLDSEENLTSFSAKSSANHIENDKVKIVFNKGLIVSYYDKVIDKEFVAKRKSMGVFSIYRDKGDCWDFKRSDARYETHMKMTAFKTGLDGPIAYAEMQFELGKNIVKQRISITDGASLATVAINVHFEGKEQVLRVAYPVNVNTDMCSFNTQFGHFERSMKEDSKELKAQYEVSGGKFIDMSDGKTGMSIINDCKHGFRCKNGVMDICLIRNPKKGPGTNVDQGEHEINLGLLTHSGNVGVETYKNSYLINNPLLCFEGDTQTQLNAIKISNENIVVEAVQMLNDGAVVRVYNSANSSQSAKLVFDGYESGDEVDIMGNKICDIDGDISFNAFELKNIHFARDNK